MPTADDHEKAQKAQHIAEFGKAFDAAIKTETIAGADDVVHEVRVQDELDRILAYNRHLADNLTKPYYGHEAVRRVGTIPMVVAEQWAKEAGVRPFSREFQEVVKKKLMSSDFQSLRVKTY